ncbi:hypothetical protein [Cytobacillus sp.]
MYNIGNISIITEFIAENKYMKYFINIKQVFEDTTFEKFLKRECCIKDRG